MNAVLQEFHDAIPAAVDSSTVDWARRHVRLIGSARSETFDPEISPWTREPIDRCDDGVTRIVTFVKPVQSGGSTVGEIALCRWLSVHNGGDVQYNWEDDEKAVERWDKRVEKILKACKPVMARWPSDRHKANKGLVIFAHCNLTVQGVFTESNVSSDSIRFQLNEELHNWEPGRLAQAKNRTTAFWNSVTANISNAGDEGDQLHQEFAAGTQQHWEVKCPGCGKFHRMRTRWEDKRPELGGLRYDSAGCKRADGSYDYNKLGPTVRFQIPCGYQVRDDPVARRALSLSGRYSEPDPGAPLAHRSYTLEAVAVDYIPWVQLIREKHAALHALKHGDPELWKTYLKERECRFWNPEDRPLMGRIVLSGALKKNRDGLANRFGRLFALDRQQGKLSAGELPHWWLLIRDVMPNGDSQLVYEGKRVTDEDVIGTLREHGCVMRFGVADSGHDTTHVYQFCLRYGIHAIKGSGEQFFHHQNPGGTPSRRIFSPERPLHAMINAPPTREYVQTGQGMVPHPDEPLFWFYSKAGIRDRLAWLRGARKWEVPGDVSEAYQSSMESEELQELRSGKTKQVEWVWVQLKKRNDLFVCECYIAMLMEMMGLIGQQAVAQSSVAE